MMSRNMPYLIVPMERHHFEPKLFKGMIIHHTPNGTNIKNCGSTYVENYVDQSKAYDLIIHDGDGDRMLAIWMDISFMDVLLCLFAKAMKKKYQT